MSYNRPFHRNYRALVPGENNGYSDWGYIVDKDYAQSPEHYIRAFTLIQNDLKNLFEFIEPSDINLNTYSYRIHALLMRTCIEVEANFKAILKENIFAPTFKNCSLRDESKWNIYDFKKVNTTHHLSSFKISLPIWNGDSSIFNPFVEWDTQSTLSWYTAYNQSKHDRRSAFKEANLLNLLNAVSGLLVVLSSQFRTEDFSTGSTLLSVSGDDYFAMTPAIGEFFRIEFPTDWEDSEKYEFNWNNLKHEPDRFNKINYNNI